MEIRDRSVNIYVIGEEIRIKWNKNNNGKYILEEWFFGLINYLDVDLRVNGGMLNFLFWYGNFKSLIFILDIKNEVYVVVLCSYDVL